MYNDRAIVKVLTFVKIRSFSRSKEELWLDEWNNPLAQEVPISSPQQFLESLQQPIGQVGYVYATMAEA
jgi:proteasome activator subunit 4